MQEQEGKGLTAEQYVSIVFSVLSCGFFFHLILPRVEHFLFSALSLNSVGGSQLTHCVTRGFVHCTCRWGNFPLRGISVLALQFLLVVHFKESLALGKGTMGFNVKLPRVEK